MRVTCPHCGSKAIITSRENVADNVSELYCSCSNTKECGATFVASLAFKHYLNPPRGDAAQLAAALLSNLPREKQLELIGL
ncbi:transcriptional regulator [Pseudoalteromonas luteoviolacea]|uniref:Transcriptional regulator n=1 Tax=Pseudoalteromonas luteoviolacea TaxID=43657 RepID=A0A1C0TVL9_9GAMM|nr:ogr/Delta-like zinc finger family protein [Pseudoalteromonas luteoviolacea]OCQ23361.1 transcriptional regulator [Pseudoalteromonas luteoviolacea]